MTQKSELLSIIFLLNLCFYSLQGQDTMPANGGNASGTGGSVSYSVGQLVYTINTGSNGTVSQGVQQPYEINVVTAMENSNGITLEYKVYPNPTNELITITTKPYINENLKYMLYDLSGILLQDKKIESEETEISMENYFSSVYFLKVLKDNLEVKTFKIIKN